MTFVLLLGLAGLPVSSFAGGIPVVDGASIQIEIMNVFKQLEEYALQLEEYALQIDQYTLQAGQYADQIKNTAAPLVYIWDEIEKKIQEIETLQSRLNSYYEMAGGFESYLEGMKNSDFWKTTEWDRLNGSEVFDHYESLNDAELAANLDLMQTIEFQMRNAGADAAQIASLQKAAAQAQGRMEAIQASNQLLANQSTHLLEMKNLLAAQANVLAQNFNAQQQAEAERLAFERAFFENYKPHNEPVVEYRRNK